ncbi:MAG: hypothetical protein IT373_02235 [Polyangiaceae bacterium]|nr:hypothetical protein [Polyangiaceae bacterium]
MRPRLPSRALALAAGLGVAATCAPRGSTPPPPPPPLGAPPSPACARVAAERPSVAALLAAGQLDRTLRALDALDQACPEAAPESWATRLRALGELGACEPARALASVVVVAVVAPPEARQAAEQVRALCAAPGAPAPPDEATWRALLLAGREARAAGREPEAQRHFDRALVEIERLTGERPRAVVAPELRADAWRRLGEHTVGLASARLPSGAELFGVAFLDRAGLPLRFVPVAGPRPYEARFELAGGAVLLAHDGVSELDPESGLVRRTLAPMGSSVHASPDGRRLAVWTRDQATVAVLDRATGATLRTVASAGPVLAWSPDGARLAAVVSAPAPAPERIVVIEVATGRELASAPVPAATARTAELGVSVSSLAFDPSGSRVAVGLENVEHAAIRLHDVGGRVGVLEVATGGLRVTDLERRPDAVSYSLDGRQLGLVCGGDHWSLPGKLVWVAAKDLRVAGDVSLALGETASFAADGSVLTTFEGRPLRVVHGPGASLPALAAAPVSAASARSLAVVGAVARVFSLRGEAARELGAGCPDAVEAVALAADDSVLAFACADHAVQLWDVRRAAPLARLPQPQPVLGLALDAAGGWVVVSLAGDSVRRFAVATGAAAGELRGSGRALAVAPDGALALVQRFPAPGLVLWPPGASSVASSVALPSAAGDAAAVAFRPDGAELAIGTAQGRVLVLDRASSAVRALDPPPGSAARGAIAGLAWRAAPGPLVALGADGLGAWDPASGRALGGRPLAARGALLLDATSDLFAVRAEDGVHLGRLGEPGERLVVRVVRPGLAVADDGRGALELLHPEARAALVCLAGTRLWPLEVCEESSLAPGLVARALAP